MTVPNDSRQAPDSPHENAPLRFRFPDSRRLRRGVDFQRVYARRCKAGAAELLVFADVNELPQTRIGLSVSRRHGNSVVRHRLRRMLREAYRLEQFRIPEGLDLILIPGRDAKSATLDTFRAALVRLTSKLNQRLRETRDR